MHLVRKQFRDRWFQLFHRSACHAEGRSSIAESLRGLLLTHADAATAMTNVATPYEELDQHLNELSHDPSPSFIAITGRFRSGSTLLWNIFRQIPTVTSFYEPLNERRWFDTAHRGTKVDATHCGVTDYWQEYDGLAELAEFYREEWTYSRLYMDERASEPELKQYIDRLARSTNNTAVLQFNRIDFRLPWLASTFPKSSIVHIMRHPRDQWYSTLGKAMSFGPNDGGLSDFEPFDQYYLRSWVADLRYWFPFLDDEAKHHPYRCYYLLWKLSYLFARKYADVLLRFEDLIANPRATLASLFERLEISIDRWDRIENVIESPPIGRWRTYASDAWFREHELHCEQRLNEYLSS
jgi:hypothetical protein